MSLFANFLNVFVKMQIWLGLVLLAACIVTGCSDSEPPKQAVISPAPLPITPAPVPAPLPITPAPVPAPVPDPPPPAETEEYIPRKTVDYMAGIKDIKDYKPVVKTEAVKETAATPTPRKVTETKAAPADPKVAGTLPAAAAPPQLIPAKVPADNIVANAAPSSQTPPVVTTATPVKRETPEFPREAIKASVESGVVRAVMSIDASGNVTNVQIVEARPARVFDRAVRDSLSRWRFNAGADGRSYQTEVEFRREP